MGQAKLQIKRARHAVRLLFGNGRGERNDLDQRSPSCSGLGGAVDGCKTHDLSRQRWMPRRPVRPQRRPGAHKEHLHANRRDVIDPSGPVETACWFRIA
jgi:hypothetical protein